jgi:hypothetical protein
MKAGPTTEKRISAEGELISSKQVAFQAIETGTAILGKLEAQGEYLDDVSSNMNLSNHCHITALSHPMFHSNHQVEDTIDANAYTLHKAEKVMRNMTWGGYFYNVATGITEIVTPSTGSRNEALESWKSSSSGSSSNNKKDKDDDSSSDDLYTDTVFRPNAYQDAVSSKTAAYLSEQDKQIEDIAAAVDIMQGLGLAIGEKMDSQNAQLNAIETKTTHVHSKTLSVSLKANKLSNYRSKPSQFIGLYQFVDTFTGKFLAVTDTEGITLSTIPDRSTLFNCYSKNLDIIGIQSAKSLKYLGATMLGTMACSGTYLGSSEECYVGLTGDETGTA